MTEQEINQTIADNLIKIRRSESVSASQADSGCLILIRLFYNYNVFVNLKFDLNIFYCINIYKWFEQTFLQLTT